MITIYKPLMKCLKGSGVRWKRGTCSREKGGIMKLNIGWFVACPGSECANGGFGGFV